MITIKDKDFISFISKESIQKRVEELGKQIAKDYKGKIPLLIGILNGSFIFAADLMRAITTPTEISFVRYASYQKMQSSGCVTEIMGFNNQLKGRDVILVEDIVDTGLTLKSLTEKITAFEPNTVTIASLLFKPEALQTGIQIDYVGFEIENKFVVGYGLDYNGLGRELKSIYVLAK